MKLIINKLADFCFAGLLKSSLPLRSKQGVMLKYRRLTLQELELLKDSFIHFLAAQSISGEDWKNLQENDSEKAESLIDQFSDVVIEKTLHNVKILEQRLPRRIVFYKFYEKHAIMIGLEVKEEAKLDLSKEFSWIELEEELEKEDVKFSIISGRKEFQEEKYREIFNILQMGCHIAENDDNFNSMLRLIGK